MTKLTSKLPPKKLLKRSLIKFSLCRRHKGANNVDGYNDYFESSCQKFTNCFYYF